MAGGLDIEIQVNQKILGDAIQSLQSAGKAVGLTVQHLMYEVAGDAAKNAQKYTAPWASGSRPTNAGGAKKTGEQSIAYDMTWKGWGNNVGLLSIMDDFTIDKNFGQGFQSFRSKDGAFFLVPNEYVLESESDIERVRQQYLNKKGRIKFTGSTWMESVGNRTMPVKRHYFARKSTMDSILKKIQTRVGELKSGWNEAIKYFCGKVGKNTGLSTWIARHNEDGGYTDNAGSDGNGEVRITNEARWVDAIRPDTIAFVQRQADKDIRTNLPKRLERIAERISNFEKSNGAEK